MDDDDEVDLPSPAVLARDRIFQLRLQLEQAARKHPTDVPALKRRLSEEMNRFNRMSKVNFGTRYGQ